MNTYHIYAAQLTVIYTDIHSGLVTTIAAYIPSTDTTQSATQDEQFTSVILTKFAYVLGAYYICSLM